MPSVNKVLVFVTVLYLDATPSAYMYSVILKTADVAVSSVQKVRSVYKVRVSVLKAHGVVEHFVCAFKMTFRTAEHAGHAVLKVPFATKACAWINAPPKHQHLVKVHAHTLRQIVCTAVVVAMHARHWRYVNRVRASVLQDKTNVAPRARTF